MRRRDVIVCGVLAACSTTVAPTPDETPQPEVAQNAEGSGPVEASPTEPVSLVLNRSQLLAGVDASLAEVGSFSSPTGKQTCAAPQDPAAIAVESLLERLDKDCPDLDAKAARSLDNALKNARFDDNPDLTGEAAKQLSACARPTLEALLAAPDLSRVCGPMRPGVGRLDLNALSRFAPIQQLGRATALQIFELAARDRMPDAVRLAVRLVELSQAAGRGQVTYLDAAMANAMTELPMARLRVELASRRGAGSLSMTSAHELAAQVDATLATEPNILDAIRGDRLGLELSTMLPIAAPEHAAVVVALGESGQPRDPAAAFGGAFAEISDPLAIIWSASVAAHDATFGVCQGKTPAQCKIADLELATAQREAFQAEVGPNDAVALLKAANPATSTEFAFRLARNAVAAPIPDFQQRGRSLIGLRLRLELASLPACPPQAELVKPRWMALRTNGFTVSPTEVAARDNSIVIDLDTDREARSDADRWRIICGIEHLPARTAASPTATRIRFSGTPHDEEETSVSLTWRASTEVNLLAEPRDDAPLVAMLVAAPASKAVPTDSAVVVIRPSRALAIANFDFGSGPVFNPTTESLSGEAKLVVKRGDEVRVYRYAAEGECYVGVTDTLGVETIAVVVCPQTDEFTVLDGSLDRPAEFQWWTQFAVGDQRGWTRVDNRLRVDTQTGG